MDAYQYAKEYSLSPIFYNGDIHFVDKWNEIKGGLGIQTKGVMLGRGLLMILLLQKRLIMKWKKALAKKGTWRKRCHLSD